MSGISRFDFLLHVLTITRQRHCTTMFLSTWLCLLCAFGHCDTGGWTWLSGQGTPSREAVYGTKGSPASENHPGARTNAATWTDSQGNLWLFGGSLDSDIENGLCNDIWKYNPTISQWTWITGHDNIDHIGIYGEKGVAHAENRPGSRNSAIAWFDEEEGNIWIFGGVGYDATGPTGLLNDLWMYDLETSMWTWVKGSKSTGAGSLYGTIGEPSNATTPGARFPGTSWTDNTGNLWLFGGSLDGSYLNDLWKFDTDTNNWTWMHGSDLQDSLGNPGEKGIPADANTPGGLSSLYSWKDNFGDFWLYGGYGTNSGSYNTYMDNLWRYDPDTNQWTWITGTNTAAALPEYGTQGEAAQTNTPGARGNGSAWKDTSGNLWLYAGASDLGFYDFQTLADLWKFDMTLSQWVWMGGTHAHVQTPVYGQNGVPAPANTPGSRKNQLTWSDADGGAWLYGGEAFLNDGTEVTWVDMWKFDSLTAQWVWTDGSKAGMPPGSYGSMGTPSPANIPGAREEGLTWVTPDGNLWLFGGYGFDDDSSLGFLSDLWKYDTDTGTWTWINGQASVDVDGHYGTKGTAHEDNHPGGRENGMTWVDNAGNLWLLGGNSIRNFVPDDIARNDLWKYDMSTGHWTWMHGGKTNQDEGIYGIQGEPAEDNTPGAREGAATWTDSSGNLWLFGGMGEPNFYTSTGLLNDLWKYDINTGFWTWIKGTPDKNQSGVYGTMGEGADANTPGGRVDAAYWIDSSDNLWLFGGDGRGESNYRGELNDLWKYDPAANQWIWMNGSLEIEQSPVYGAEGEAAAENTPGSKFEAASWTDQSGKFWLYGGLGATADRNAAWPSSDLWMYDPATNYWTWMGGSTGHYELPRFGTQGEMGLDTTPGARHDAMAWSSQGMFWLFGGNAMYDSQYNDMWVYGAGIIQSSASDWQLYN